MHSRILTIFLVALALLTWVGTGQAQDLELRLSVGDNRSIPAMGVKSYSEGTEGIVQVRLTPDGEKFVVVGRQPGSTTLLLIRKDGRQLRYKIRVSRYPMSEIADEINELLGTSPGLRVKQVGERLFIEGGVSSESELKRVESIAKLYEGQVESLVVVGGPAAERHQNIRLDIYYIQVERGKGYQVGVAWPDSVRASASAAYDFTQAALTQATAQVVDQALPGLDFAASKGWAKVLKHSTVITANGSEALFSSGGEENFKVIGGLSATIQTINFGTKVTVLPRFDSKTGDLEIKLAAEVADLTVASSPGTELPGRSTTNLETLVGLKLGQGIVLSGIRSWSQRHDIKGIPLLSEIPILGVLFGSHKDERQEIEGAIYMVPSIVESVSADSEQMVNDLLEVYDDFDGDMPESLPKYQRGAN